MGVCFGRSSSKMEIVRHQEKRKFRSRVFGNLKRLVLHAGQPVVFSATCDGVTVEAEQQTGAVAAFRFPETARRVLALAARPRATDAGADAGADADADGSGGSGLTDLAVLFEARSFRVYVALVTLAADSAGGGGGLVLTELTSLAGKAAQIAVDRGSRGSGGGGCFELLPFGQSVAVGLRGGGASPGGGQVLVASLLRVSFAASAWRSFASCASPSEQWLEAGAEAGAGRDGRGRTRTRTTSLLSRLLSFGGAEAAETRDAESGGAGGVGGVLSWADAEGVTWLAVLQRSGTLGVYRAPRPDSRTGECYAETKTRATFAGGDEDEDAAAVWTLGWLAGTRVLWVAEGAEVAAYEAATLKKLSTGGGSGGGTGGGASGGGSGVRSPFPDSSRVVAVAASGGGAGEQAEGAQRLWLAVQTESGALELAGVDLAADGRVQWVASESWSLEAALHEAQGFTAEALATAWQAEAEADAAEAGEFAVAFWRREILRHFAAETVQAAIDPAESLEQYLRARDVAAGCAAAQALLQRLAAGAGREDSQYALVVGERQEVFGFAFGSVRAVVATATETETEELSCVSAGLTCLGIPAFGRSRFRASTAALTKLSGRPAWRALLGASLLTQSLGAGAVRLASEYTLVFSGTAAFDEALTAGLLAAASELQGSVAEKTLDGCGDWEETAEDVVALVRELRTSDANLATLKTVYRDLHVLGLWLRVRRSQRCLSERLRLAQTELDFPRLLRRVWACAAEEAAAGASEAVRGSTVEFLSWALAATALATTAGDGGLFRRALAAEEASEAWRAGPGPAGPGLGLAVAVVANAVRRRPEAMLAEEVREVGELAQSLEAGEEAWRAQRGVYWLWRYSARGRRETDLEQAAAEWRNLEEKGAGWVYVRGLLGARIFEQHLERRNFSKCLEIIEISMSHEQAARACRLLVAEAEQDGRLSDLFPSWPFFLQTAAAEHFQQNWLSAPNDHRTARRLWGVWTKLGRHSEASELAKTMVAAAAAAHADVPADVQAETLRMWLVLAQLGESQQEKEKMVSGDFRKQLVVEAAKRRTGESELGAVVKKLQISEAVDFAKAAGLDLWTWVVRPTLAALRCRSPEERLAALGRLVHAADDASVAVQALTWCLRQRDSDGRAAALPSEVVVQMERGDRWVLLLDMLMRFGRWSEAARLAKAHMHNWRPRFPGRATSELVPVAKLQQLRDCLEIFRPDELPELDAVLAQLKNTLKEDQLV